MSETLTAARKIQGPRLAPKGDEYLTPDQLAEELGLRLQTIAAWRSQRRGPAFVKIGHYVVYRKADIVKWLESRTVAPVEA